MGNTLGLTPANTQEQLTTLIQKQVIDIMSSSKFGSAAAITQSVDIAAIGADSKNTGVDIKQVANINVSAFLNDKTALELKSDLKEKLTNSIKNEASNMPFGQQQNVNTKIANVVDKSIESKFSREAIVELNNAVNQSVKLAAVAGGVNQDIAVYQKADVIAKFSSAVATDIATQLVGDNVTTNVSETKTTNFLAETVGAVGKAIGDTIKGLLTGVYAGPVMMFVMFMCVVLVGIYIARGGSKPTVVYRQAVGPAGGTTPADLGIDMSSLPHVGSQ